MQIVPQQDSPLANRQERSEGAESSGMRLEVQKRHIGMGKIHFLAGIVRLDCL